MKPKLTAHMIVKNDDLWVHHAIASILPYVDHFLITDTGSSDHTISQIKTIKSTKIQLTSVKTTDITKVRGLQLTQTKTDWLWMIDGDEIFPQSVCQEIINHLNPKLAGIIVKRYDCLGDIYHYQPDESVGAYSLPGVTGHYNLRLVNCRIPGLHLSGIYPNEGFYDQTNRALVTYPANNFYVTKNGYIHTTYLTRSSLGSNLSGTLHRKKYKIEWGKKLPQEIVHSLPATFPKRGHLYNLQAALVTPIKIIKRKLIK